MVWGAFRAKAESDAARVEADRYFSSWSVRKKLMCALIPSVLVVLVVAGYATNWFSARYLNQALQRTAQVQNLAQAREMEQVLDAFRLSLLALTRETPDEGHLRAAISRWNQHFPDMVRELAFVGASEADSLLLLQTGAGVQNVRREQFGVIKAGPIAPAQKLRGLRPGDVQFSDPAEAVYPPAIFPSRTEAQSYVLFRLLTPVPDGQGGVRGYLSLGLDARALRNILSLYNSARSPLYAYSRTSETRFSYFFDDQGWILFQSENYEEPDRPLSTEGARLGMTGDYGLQDYGRAFRPLPSQESYWRMVVDVQAGRSGVNDMDLWGDSADLLSPSHFLVYAPVRFMENPEKGPSIIGGIAYVDRSRLVDVAEFRHLDVMLIITISGMGLVALVIVFISRAITAPMHGLAADMRAMFEEKTLRPVRASGGDLESGLLARAFNQLVESLRENQELLRRRDEEIHKVQLREKVSLGDECLHPHGGGLPEGDDDSELIGQSQAMLALQSLIRKAAAADADVLIAGETGTGKELTASAIHRQSARAAGPFISINCGGLDENLLMDTLFGHVKGAFTEAKTDRKGAFLASDGGTLFLDEIGTATPAVQKALLRALSVRRIRPLGSDRESEFDVRVIAATNENLIDLVQRGEFRDDLYYRLKVIFIQMPPLRQRREDIPILADHFLRELSHASGRAETGLSRGALEKLLAYDWPGNVRELKNCITRALAFTEGDVLYDEDLHFDEQAAGGDRVHVIPVRQAPQPGQAAEPQNGQAASGDAARTEPVAPESAQRPAVSLLSGSGQLGQSGQPGQSGPFAQSGQSGKADGAARTASFDIPTESAAETGAAPVDSAEASSRRVRAALRLARERGEFSRLDYQQALGPGVSQRTAQYDLRALVKAGRLRKTGKGPSTRYLLP